MDCTILNRAVFLIERADVPRAFPSQNQAEELFASVAAAASEQRMLSMLLARSLLGLSREEMLDIIH